MTINNNGEKKNIIIINVRTTIESTADQLLENSLPILVHYPHTLAYGTLGGARVCVSKFRRGRKNDVPTITGSAIIIVKKKKKTIF